MNRRIAGAIAALFTIATTAIIRPAEAPPVLDVEPELPWGLAPSPSLGVVPAMPSATAVASESPSPRPTPSATARPFYPQISGNPSAGWATVDETIGSGFLGAVHSYTWGDRHYLVRVCAVVEKARCVIVEIVSYCACGPRHGIPTVIDLSPAAMRRLAGPRWRQLGVYRVLVIGIRP